MMNPQSTTHHPSQGPFPWLRHILNNHPAFTVTAAYLLFSGSGLFYAWYKFLPFGINILDFAGPNDLFFAGLKKPYLLAAPLFFVAALYALMWFTNRSERPTPFWRFMNWALLLTMSALFFLFIHFVNGLGDLDDQLSSFDGNALITLQSSPSDPVHLLVLETTNRFLLAVDPPNADPPITQFDRPWQRPEAIRVIPFSQIRELTFPLAPPPSAAGADLSESSSKLIADPGTPP